MNQLNLKPIDKCSLKELLALFNIDELTEEELKNARRKVLMLHPDKNPRQDTKDYYEYFSIAYIKLKEIYSFINPNKRNKSEEVDLTTTQKSFREYYVKQGLDRNIEQFNKQFNQDFEKINVKEDDGYGEWLKSNEAIYDNKDIEKSRKNAMQLVKRDEKIITYNEIHNQYSDLKEAHVNSVIAMDANDVYKKTQKFRSVEEYQKFRTESTRDINLINKEKEHLKILKEQQREEQNDSMNLAFDLMKKTEKATNKFNEYCSKYLMLK